MALKRDAAAVLLGAAVAVLPFALIGSFSGHQTIGATVGVLVGGFVSLAAYRGWIGAPATGGIVGAVLSALFGPAIDDYSGISIVPGLLSGMVAACVVRAVGRGLKALGWRSLYLLPAVLAGIVAVATRGTIWIMIFTVILAVTLDWDPSRQGTPFSRRRGMGSDVSPPRSTDTVTEPRPAEPGAQP